MFLVRGLTEPLHGPLVTWLRAFTIFIGDSHLKLCICIALVRGLSVPQHGPLVTLLLASAIFIGDSQAKLRICIALVRGLSIQLHALKWCQSLSLGIPF